MTGESEALLRLSIFLGLFGVLAASEVIWPRRRSVQRGARWVANFSLVALNTVLLRLTFFIVPALPALAALYVEEGGWGLLPALGLNGFVAGAIAFVALDLALYLQHVAFHFAPALWRIHRVHHADIEFDASTGLRFHAIEILLSQAWKIAVVLALGAPAAAVLAFEIVLNATSMFSHANIHLPGAVDRVVRLVAVTPDMHRVHHSTLMHETDSNFGFNFAFWDRVFGTYRSKPEREHATMPIGLASYRGSEAVRLGWMLQFPFLKGARA